MSKSLNISKYDPGMMDVLEAVCETGKACEIPYADQVTAKAERFQFYGLVRAIQASQHTLAPKAARLIFSLGGASKNILTISLGDDKRTNFYAAIAEKHLSK